MEIDHKKRGSVKHQRWRNGVLSAVTKAGIQSVRAGKSSA